MKSKSFRGQTSGSYFIESVIQSHSGSHLLETVQSQVTLRPHISPKWGAKGKKTKSTPKTIELHFVFKRNRNKLLFFKIKEHICIFIEIAQPRSRISFHLEVFLQFQTFQKLKNIQFTGFSKAFRDRSDLGSSLFLFLSTPKRWRRWLYIFLHLLL